MGQNVATIRKFEDIQAWQFARELTKDLYKLIKVGSLSKDYFLRDQLIRSSTSIVLNIAEGFGRKTDKDFARFLIQARGSCAELQSALYMALDKAHIQQEVFDDLYNKTTEISKMLTSFNKYLSK